jgi:hypothetical protein
MGIHRGPNIVKDNLVFGYDTGYGVADNSTATRFYPGEPTENLIYDMGGTVTSAYPQVVYRSTAIETNVADISAPGGKYSRFTGIDDSSNNQLYSQFSSYSIDVRGDSVNYSVYLKGSGTCHLTIYDNNSGYGTSPTITLTSNWVRYNYTRTVNASATTYWVAVRGILDTTNVYIAGQQATRGTHSTPYIENNRSSTQSLIDLKRTTDIDVSNISFNSTGQPDFDGTDDIITQSRIIDTASYSAEFVFKADVNTSGTEHWLGSQYPGTGRVIFDLYTNNRLRNFIDGTSINGATTIETGTWYHAVFTRNSLGVAYIYLNGIQDATGTLSTTTPVNDPFDIGGSTTLTRWFNGNIAVVKIYNTELTAAQAAQNFNAYKNRFNI